jgi:5-methylcytosine-specific restriction endonuclease McrA
MSPKQKRYKKNQLLRIYGDRCFWSGYKYPQEKLTIDHVLPRSKGGSNNLENPRLACRECNRSRGDSLFPPLILRCHNSFSGVE